MTQWSPTRPPSTGCYVHAALRAGASGFLLKDARPEELLAGIRAVAGGDAVIAPALTRRLLDEYARHAPGSGGSGGAPGLASLTEREREILVAVGKGWTNGEIAARLVVSESTVKTHVGRVLAKIGARDRIQAVIFAYDQGSPAPVAAERPAEVRPPAPTRHSDMTAVPGALRRSAEASSHPSLTLQAVV